MAGMHGAANRGKQGCGRALLSFDLDRLEHLQ
jgi:hypothetical protein